jgi:hypothetical protein
MVRSPVDRTCKVDITMSYSLHVPTSMTSRRRYLAALGALCGLAGCNDPIDSSNPAEPPPQTGAGPETALSSSTPTPGAPTRTDQRTDATGGTTRRTATEEETATPDPLGDRFGTILDVTEHGVDPSGSRPVGDRIASLVDDDTLLRFPSGTYPLHDLEVAGVSNFGMVGDGATLEPLTLGREIFLAFRRSSDILLEGFRVDNSETNVAAWCDLKVTGGTNVVRDYVVEDFVDVNERTNGFTIMVEGGETSLTLENVDISKGAVNGAAVFVFPRREFYDPERAAGSLAFRDCVMKGWGKEGLYASPHEGPLEVVGGEYANNAIVQVRVGGGGAENRAVVRDVTVTVDRVPDYMPEYNQLLRGIWLKEGDRALVENCDVTIADVGVGQTPGAIYVNDQFGRATIRDCTVTTENVSRPAFLIQEPTDEYDPGRMPSLDELPTAWDVTVENVTIDGESPNTETIYVQGRDGVTLRDLSVDKRGQANDGILLEDARDCRLEGGSLTTERFPVVINFDGEDVDCALAVAGTAIEGTDLYHDGEQLSGDGEYCVGSGALADSRRDEHERLSLTRSDDGTGNDGTATSTPAEEGGDAASNVQSDDEYRLYGRWLGP